MLEDLMIICYIVFDYLNSSAPSQKKPKEKGQDINPSRDYNEEEKPEDLDKVA